MTLLPPQNQKPRVGKRERGTFIITLSPLQNSKSNNNFMYLTWATKTTTTTKAKAKATKAAKGTTSSRVLEWLL